MRNFKAILTDAALASWAQVLVLVVGFLVAVMQLRNGDHNNAVNVASQYVQKFVEGDYHQEIGRFSVRQYNIIQKVKLEIGDYDSAKDPGYVHLFALARPKIAQDLGEQDKELSRILKIEKFFEMVSECVEGGACDPNVIRTAFKEEMRIYYNAVCPYLDALRAKWGTPYYQNTLFFLYYRAGMRDASMYLCRDFLPDFLNASFFVRAVRYVKY